MSHFEDSVKQFLQYSPKIWIRYVDVIFTVLQEYLQEYLQLNIYSFNKNQNLEHLLTKLYKIVEQ